MTDKYCTHCGRELVQVIEPKGFDSQTGKPITEVWIQCPKYPRRGIVALLRGPHDSFKRDNPLVERHWM